MIKVKDHGFLITIFTISFLTMVIINGYTFSYYTNDHDEGVYIFQSKMLAEGKIYLESDDYSKFFDAWFIINDGEKIYPKYTPIHSLFLATSYVLFGNMVFAIGILSGLSLIFIYLITKEVYDINTAKMASIICLLSPLFIIISSTYLSYTSSFLLSLIFIYFFIKSDNQNYDKENKNKENKIYYIISGITLGLLFFDRPYDGILIGAPFLLYMTYKSIIDKEYKINRKLFFITISFLPIFIVVLYYNYFLTGSPLVFPFSKYETLDILGFGMKRIDQYSPTYLFTTGASIEATKTFLYQLLFNWTLGGIFLIFFMFILYREKRILTYEKLFLILFIFVVIGNFMFWGTYHFLKWENSLNILGPVYYFNLLFPISIISGRVVNYTYELKKN